MEVAGAYRNKTLGKEEVTDWCLLAGGTGQCSATGRSTEGAPGLKGSFVQRNRVSSFKAPIPTSPSDSCLRAGEPHDLSAVWS